MTDISNPNWPEELLEPIINDRRNLIDHYKYWKEEAIIADLDQRRHSFAVICENLANDFNVGTTVRNCNAFLAKEIWIIGRRGWDKRGAVGTYKYQHVHYAPTSVEVIEDFRARDYHIVAIDNQEGASNIYDYHWAEKTLMIFGQEQIGVSPESLSLADECLYIPQFGSTRSLNVGVASGMAMFSWIGQHGKSA